VTQQRQNELMLAGESYGLAEVDGDWPGFDPERHGLPLEFVGTDCWDGYWCGYRVDELLLLDVVSIGWSSAHSRQDTPLLYGRRARRVDEWSSWARYEDLGQSVRFTGSLLAGRGLVLHSGLTPVPYAYAAVAEWTFTDGRLVAQADVTAEMERYRSEWEAWWPQPRDWNFEYQPGDTEDEARANAEFSAYREEALSYTRFFGSRRRVRAQP
jgi:hypothetical protein